MAVYGMGNDPYAFMALERAFEKYKKACGDDPACKDYVFQITQAMRGLQLLEASPGQRAAYAAMGPNPMGQEPTPRKSPAGFGQ